MNEKAPPPLAVLSNVTVSLGRPLLCGLDFTLMPGAAWLIGGPNGGGKSSFLRVLRGELLPNQGERTYHLGGQVSRSGVRALRALALVSPEQEAFYLTRDWLQTVGDVLLSGLSGEALRLSEPGTADLARLAEVAAQTGLNALLERDFRTLSHGQRRRALLGRALMPRPAALLLDEFTDGLSAAARAELGEVLRGVWQSGVAVVLVTHRPEEAPDLPWQRAWIEGGRLKPGQPGLDRPAQALRVSSPTSSSAPAPMSPAPIDPAPLIVVEQAEVYRNGHHALGPVTWTWHSGEHWLVTGENGAGKSTLARLIAGELHPALGGQVHRPFLQRERLERDLGHLRRQQIGLLGAEVAIRQRRDWTGLEVIGSAFGGTEGFTHELNREQRRRVLELAGRLGVGELLTRSAATLSQGQWRRLLLARALVARPRLIILDEGLDFLDAESRLEVTALIAEAQRQGSHLLVVSHREADVPPGLTHHLKLGGGKVVSSGPLRQA
ncbi:ATP-binding cassette domain-containing protein [Deinococcus sp.]|uniref:ATP-binding cassette domain-containing protein n=1 Tax=Deinococcus sp. TaxID=47478 RepID=UPI0025E70E85|nr:ATP-binding cassette domain-containing protein [Deinococcus sp.]